MNIDIFDNPKPDRDFTIQHVAEEFTSVCPVTGHPDFGKIILTYIADEKCIELKTYKEYLQGYRNEEPPRWDRRVSGIRPACRWMQN